MVVGIVFVLVSGWAALALDPGTPWTYVLGIFFGAGAALTLDEFALWLYLKDVYWMEEGRASIDAVILAFMLGTVVALGMSPVGIDDSAAADVLTAPRAQDTGAGSRLGSTAGRLAATS